MSCKVCGKNHSILESLEPDCLATIKVITKQEIFEALEKGRKDRELFEQYQQTMYRFYK